MIPTTITTEDLAKWLHVGQRTAERIARRLAKIHPDMAWRVGTRWLLSPKALDVLARDGLPRETA